ncbi:MAG TPA: MFS transporter [Victivallales bacterium]|nr:MFS transporter [Victivallales bacterium]
MTPRLERFAVNEKTSTQEQGAKLETRRGMANAIYCQCFGLTGYICFNNGLILLYLLFLGFEKEKMLSYLSGVAACQGIFLIPAAYLADRIGMKRCGTIGANMQVLGFALLIPTAFMGTQWHIELILLLGFLLFSLGFSLFSAPWFPILKNLVPAEMRGVFFARLRISWQLLGLLVSGLAAIIIQILGNFPGYPILWSLIMGMMAIRIFFYSRIPGLADLKTPGREGILIRLKQIISKTEYISFSSYLFLLTFFTASCPLLFAIIEKEFLNLPSTYVLWLANATIVGNLAGFYLGGLAVDKAGTKPVFLVCHFSYSLIIILFLARGLIPEISMPVIATAHFAFGVIYAASGIAITTESIALLPEKNQSLASAFIMTASTSAGGISGIVCAFALKAGFLSNEWNFLGTVMCASDAILLSCAGMVVFMVITLGLVPSVIQKDKSGISPL